VTPRLEVVPDDSEPSESWLRARGVPASLTWVSALAVIALVVLLVVAAVALLAHYL
jgi:hypothetical protein